MLLGEKFINPEVYLFEGKVDHQMSFHTRFWKTWIAAQFQSCNQKSTKSYQDYLHKWLDSIQDSIPIILKTKRKKEMVDNNQSDYLTSKLTMENWW